MNNAAASTRRFGLELTKFLVGRSFTERDLMRVMNTLGTAISRQHINMITHNQRLPSPDMIENMGNALKLTREERGVLHHAAALDAGYRIGPIPR